MRVSRGEHAFKLVTLKSTNFYEAFRTKFNFRIRPDAIPSRDTSDNTNGPPAIALTLDAADTDGAEGRRPDRAGRD